MVIDYTVSIGVILQSVVVIGGALIVLGVMRKSVNDLEADVSDMEKDLKDLTKTVAAIAVQDQRLNRIEEDIRDLKHGKGLVLNGFIPPSP